MKAKANKVAATIAIEADPMFQPMLLTNFPIGYHVSKEKSIRATLQNLGKYDRPYQVFFTSRTANFKVDDSDILQTADFVKAHDAKLYVHTPYILNLCMEPGTHEEPNYVVECLRKHLKTGTAMGLKGVIVHVGKSTTKPLDEAMKNMHTNIIQSLDDASPACPLLLETPAGQGTETLTTLADFMGFAVGFKDNRFGICVDTCHVFATGTLPVDYLTPILNNSAWRPLLKLVHFNDSKAVLGAHVDRHAPLGTGYISKDQLLECAKLATQNNIAMIIE